ncbi:MAG TPA: hypothetical protein VF117_00175 [Gammaproteobacteria bacterium]
MKLKLILMAVLLSGLLTGCQTRAQQDVCFPFGITAGSPSDVDTLYFMYIAGCETAKTINSSLKDRDWSMGANNPQGKIANTGKYQSADNIFTVAFPGPLAGIGHGGYRINEQYLSHDDYVFFAPSESGSPFYGIKVTPKLDREYASLGMAEYADLSMQDARLQAQRYSGAALKLINNQALELDGKPALFRVYLQSLPANRSAVSSRLYYLVYFIKQDDRAAILSVMWPKPCPQCETGNEQSIRGMDPGLRRFVSSFTMGSNG